MARAINRLSARTVATLAKSGRYADGQGLYLSISDNGGKRWVFIFKRGGKAREMGLGSAAAGAVGLARARDLASDARDLLAKGIDPISERQRIAAEQQEVPTFGECAEGYINAHKSSWKNAKHADQWRMTLLGVDPKGRPAKNDYCKSIRGLPVDRIGDGHIMRVLEPIWSVKTETASRVRGRIEKVLDRAKVLKFRRGDNPARWTGHLAQLLPGKTQIAPAENHPALPYRQLPEFLAELRRRPGIAARALEFTILTAARTAETIGGIRREIDESEKLWIVPKERMKGRRGARKRDHVVPLTAQAQAILAAPHLDGEYLFPGANDEPLSNAAMGAVIDRMNEDRTKAGLPKWVDPQQGDREIVPHGFRSTFKDWCSDETDYPNEMSEVALSHTLPDKVEAAYRRGSMLQKRRAMMADWAAFCEGRLVSAGVVVAMSRASA
jgi:integrase